MSASTENLEVKAAKAKKVAGRSLTPGEEVLIAVDGSNRAASEAVARGSIRANGNSDPKSDKSGRDK